MNAGEGQAGLELRAVSITLAGRALLELTLTVPAGQVVTLMGPSGSGKSALLGYLCGMLEGPFVAQGEVYLRARRIDELPPELRHIGILFQDDLLFPHLSVSGNLAFAVPASIRGQERRQPSLGQGVGDVLAAFGDRDPATLSGGQRARVALMRVLLSAPQALLLDEPFSKLDIALRGQFRTFVFAEAIARRLPVIMVTHDPADAEAAGGPVIELGKGREVG